MARRLRADGCWRSFSHMPKVHRVTATSAAASAVVRPSLRPLACVQLRRQRIALFASAFGFSRPQGHPNARYQKGYGTQVGWLRRRL